MAGIASIAASKMPRRQRGRRPSLVREQPDSPEGGIAASLGLQTLVGAFKSTASSEANEGPQAYPEVFATQQQLETVQELLLKKTNKIDEHKAHQDLNPDLQRSGSPDSEAKLPLEEKVNIVRRERRASMTSMEIDTAIPTPVHPSRSAEAKASTLDVSGRFQALTVPRFCFTARCVLWTAVWDSFQLGCKHIGMAVLLALP
eukprot:CAMPEP_0177701312 /NCGR_PEP_ID=MMETSP0484_2-20121128/6547_1 /TAXON_ID=354590 /ORGANISM="Rhodomonas lens, Strain RHODO" /LENGTH=201 /DNA_ID=CAMNT_0019212543 /DNA_START=278 /DNA_END=880 /DNA_ORIENTATION=+